MAEAAMETTFNTKSEYGSWTKQERAQWPQAHGKTSVNTWTRETHTHIHPVT